MVEETISNTVDKTVKDRVVFYNYTLTSFFRMILNFLGSHTTELDERQLNRRIMMSRPRKNPEKILKKFSAHAIFKKVFFRLFQTNDSFFDIAQMELFGPYEPINSLEALLAVFGDLDFGPETEFQTLTEMINFQVF